MDGLDKLKTYGFAVHGCIDGYVYLWCCFVVNDEAKTGIRGKLCVASNHEMQMVQTCEHSPHEVLHHGVILVLTTAVVSMQTGDSFTKTMVAENKVQQADNCVRPLACITGFINNEVYLPRDGFTAHPKDGGLPRC